MGEVGIGDQMYQVSLADECQVMSAISISGGGFWGHHCIVLIILYFCIIHPCNTAFYSCNRHDFLTRSPIALSPHSSLHFIYNGASAPFFLSLLRHGYRPHPPPPPPPPPPHQPPDHKRHHQYYKHPAYNSQHRIQLPLSLLFKICECGADTRTTRTCAAHARTLSAARITTRARTIAVARCGEA